MFECKCVCVCVPLALFLSSEISLNWQKYSSMANRSGTSEHDNNRCRESRDIVHLLVNGMLCFMASIQPIQRNPWFHQCVPSNVCSFVYVCIILTKISYSRGILSLAECDFCCCIVIEIVCVCVWVQAFSVMCGHGMLRHGRYVRLCTAVKMTINHQMNAKYLCCVPLSHVVHGVTMNSTAYQDNNQKLWR